ncbi:MAG TPA: hypothetical protein DCX53_11395 [Anaerolineae bacterium]|nr:hypothetical protein [Anaerolineae bacterium]
MMTRYLRLAHYLLIISLAGCSSLAPLLTTPTTVPVITVTATPQLDPTPTTSVQTTGNILRVWLPPQFDPSAETESSGLLNQRLKAFEAGHSEIRVEVRIKDGATDIVDVMSVTNRAAPTTMPDLIALSYSQMQEAASAGFLHPLDGLTDILQGPDWYVFARELSSVQNTQYGIPFAADAMMVVYRSSVFETPPSDWDSIFNSGTQMVFSLSESQSFFPLSLYLSANGQLVDEQGAFTLEEDVLVDVLSHYQRAYEAGAIPLSYKEIQSDAKALEYYRNGDSDISVIWASSDIKVNSGAYTALLGLDDVPDSIGDGWVWALAGPSAENLPLAVELASHLVESEYMAEWTQASGYLPTRPLALGVWENETIQEEVDNVLLASHPIPSADAISMFGPLIHGALIRIFNGEQAEVVARSVIENLK